MFQYVSEILNSTKSKQKHTFFKWLEFGWNYQETKNPKTLSINELGFTSEVPSGFEPL